MAEDRAGDVNSLSALDADESGVQPFYNGFKISKPVAREPGDYETEFQGAQVKLAWQAAVNGNKDVKSLLCHFDEQSVLYTAPAVFGHGLDGVTSQEMLKTDRDALV